MRWCSTGWVVGWDCHPLPYYKCVLSTIDTIRWARIHSEILFGHFTGCVCVHVWCKTKIWRTNVQWFFVAVFLFVLVRVSECPVLFRIHIICCVSLWICFWFENWPEPKENKIKWPETNGRMGDRRNISQYGRLFDFIGFGLYFYCAI